MLYRLTEDLIYINSRGHRSPRLCIPLSLEKEVFQAVYNELSYISFYRAYARVNEGLYIYRLLRRMRKYLEHCPNY